MNKNSQSVYIQTPIPGDIRVIFVLRLQQIICLVHMHINSASSSYSHTNCLPVHTFLVLLKPPNRHHPLTVYTSVSLPNSEHTRLINFLHIVRHHLNHTLNQQWAGSTGAFIWPAQASCFNPRYF
jgi:hypothetical protein